MFSKTTEIIKELKQEPFIFKLEIVYIYDCKTPKNKK